MERKELYEEGLFITEDSDKFFRDFIKSDEDGEGEEYIQKLTDKVSELQKKEKGNIWHCIFSVVMEPMIQYKNDKSDEVYDDYSDLTEILRVLYSDPVFMALDVAQSIIYNLYRLGERDTYDIDKDKDMELWEQNGLDKMVDIGRIKYGKEKKLCVDLKHDLKRLKRKYAEYPKIERQTVYLPRVIEGSKIVLEDNFMELNIPYIANEKFQDYLYNYKYDSDCYETLMGLIKLLNEKQISPMQYIWEKMTNFNVINIETKFLLKIIEKRRMKKGEIKTYINYMVKRHRSLFKTINNMTNVLTRLLILKIVFRYIAFIYSGVNDDLYLDRLLDKLDESLYKLNGSYSKSQRAILETAVSIRWNLNKKIDVDNWLAELEEEYPIDLFEALFLSSGIDDDLIERHGSVAVGDKEIELSQQEKNRFLWLAFERRQYVSSVRKLKLLMILEENKYTDFSKLLAEELCQKGWVSIAAMEDAINRPEKLCFQSRVGGIVYTQTIEGCSDIKKEGEKDQTVNYINICDEYEEKAENIKQVIDPWLLSRYNKVIFENTISRSKLGKYNEIFNMLLHEGY